MKFELAELPFERDALEPHIGAKTVDIHYNRHHAGYMKKLDKALQGDARQLPLEKIIKQSFEAQDSAVFNSAAQVWNHDFYWQSLSPEMTAPSSELERAIDRDFGSVEEMRTQFAETAASEFGSGWAWLAQDPVSEGLRILSTTDAVTPIVFGLRPLLTLDVWEHAYYLDYQNERPRYIEAFLESMINWDFASSRYEQLANAA